MTLNSKKKPSKQAAKKKPVVKPCIQGFVPNDAGSNEVWIDRETWLDRGNGVWELINWSTCNRDGRSVECYFRLARPAELKTFLREISAVKKKRSLPPSPPKPSLEEINTKLFFALRAVVCDSATRLSMRVESIVQNAISVAKSGGVK